MVLITTLDSEDKHQILIGKIVQKSTQFMHIFVEEPIIKLELVESLGLLLVATKTSLQVLDVKTGIL